MLTETKIRWIPGLLVAVVLICVAMGGNAPTSSSPSRTIAVSPLSVAPPPNTSGPLSYHSALFVNATGPSGYIQPGEQISAQLQARSPTYALADGPAEIQVPASIVQFSSTTGTIRLYLAAIDVLLASNASVQVSVGPSVRWVGGVAFNATSTAYLSTQGLAVSASWAYPGYPVQLSWRWVMTAVDGTPKDGVWSPWAQVTPPQIASLDSPASTWTEGQSYSLCLAGPVAGRTFAVHVSIATPVEQFTTATITVPTTSTADYCWNNSLPANVTPQQAFIHVWQFANVTFQLYDYPIDIVASGSNTTSPGLFALPGPVPLLIIAVIGIGVIVVAAVAVSSVRRGRKGTKYP
jgi:hypothetical protein